MSKRRITLAERELLDVLNRQTLRRLAQLTTIGKNRLHRLRRFPLDAKLYELVRMANAGLLNLTIQLKPLHHVRS